MSAATSPRTLDVMVVDDHDLLREGVAAALSGFQDVRVIVGASSGEQALPIVAKHQPHVVLVDLVMPGMGGIETIRRLRSLDEELGIVALSSFSEGDQIRAAIDAGANGYLTKSVDAESLARAVRSTAAGQGVFSPEATAALATARSRSDESTWKLTEREAEIAGYVAQGSTNAEIAHRLGLSLFTVKNHVSHILAKVGAQTRTEAAAAIIRSREPLLAVLPAREVRRRLRPLRDSTCRDPRRPGN